MYEQAKQRKLWRSDSLHTVSGFSFRLESWFMTKGRFTLSVTFLLSPFHLRSVRLVCVHTVRRVQSPSGRPRDHLWRN